VRRSWPQLLAWALLAAACDPAAQEETRTSAAVPVEVAAAHVGTLRAVVAATGTAEPALGADWTIVAPQPARVAEITKSEGDAVKQGELLVRFDAPALRSDLATRTGEVAAAQARLDNARKNQARLSGLFERGIASRKEVENAETEWREAEAAVRQSKGTQAAAEELAEQATVHARFDGIVAHRFHNPGDVVEAAASDPVLRVVDPTRMQVSAAVPVAALAQVSVGQPARVFVPGGGTPGSAEPARVLGLPAAVDVATGTAVVRLALEGSTRLTPGTAVQVEIQTEEHTHVVIVPAAALVREEDKTSVYVLGPDQHAHRKPVSTGIVAGDEAEIRAGVAASEMVIVKGQEELPDGAAVTVAK
jgi:RND family efflux transporter MFP subunit